MSLLEETGRLKLAAIRITETLKQARINRESNESFLRFPNSKSAADRDKVASQALRTPPARDSRPALSRKAVLRFLFSYYHANGKRQ